MHRKQIVLGPALADRIRALDEAGDRYSRLRFIGVELAARQLNLDLKPQRACPFIGGVSGMRSLDHALPRLPDQSLLDTQRRCGRSLLQRLSVQRFASSLPTSAPPRTRTRSSPPRLAEVLPLPDDSEPHDDPPSPAWLSWQPATGRPQLGWVDAPAHRYALPPRRLRHGPGRGLGSL